MTTALLVVLVALVVGLITDLLSQLFVPSKTRLRKILRKPAGRLSLIMIIALATFGVTVLSLQLRHEDSDVQQIRNEIISAIQTTVPQAISNASPPLQPPTLPSPQLTAGPFQTEHPIGDLLPSTTVPELAQRAADYLNNLRSDRRLPQLQVDKPLTLLAMSRSLDMAQQDYFSHVTPDGLTIFIMMDNAGIPHAWAGENLARDNFQKPGEALDVTFRDFLGSPAHADNLFNPHYERVGIGVAKALNKDGSIYMTYFTFLFAGDYEPISS